MKAWRLCVLLLTFLTAAFADDNQPERSPAAPSLNSQILRASLLSSGDNYPKIATVAALGNLLENLSESPENQERLRLFATKSFSDDQRYVGSDLDEHYWGRLKDSVNTFADVASLGVPGWSSVTNFGKGVAQNGLSHYKEFSQNKKRDGINLESDQEIAQAILDLDLVVDRFVLNCAKKPQLCAAVSPAFESNFAFSPLAPYEDNLKRFPQFLTSQHLQKLVALVPELQKDVERLGLSVKAGMEKVEVAVKNWSSATPDSLANAYMDLVTAVDGSASLLNENLQLTRGIAKKLAIEEQVKIKSHVDGLQRAALANGVYLLGGVARAIDKDSGKMLEGTLRTALMVRDSIASMDSTLSRSLTSSFFGKRPGQIFVGSVNLVAGLAQATEFMLGLLLGGGDPNVAIFKMLESIQKQLAQLQERVETRFDLVDLKLNGILKVIVSTFDILSEQNRALLKDTHFIRGQLSIVQQSLDRLEHLLQSYNRSVADRVWALETAHCITPEGSVLSESDLMSCVKKFAKALPFGRDALATDRDTNVVDSIERYRTADKLREVSARGPSILESANSQTIWDFVNPLAKLTGNAWSHLREKSPVAIQNADNLFFLAGTANIIPNVAQLNGYVEELSSLLRANSQVIPGLQLSDRAFIGNVIQTYQREVFSAQTILDDLVRLKPVDPLSKERILTNTLAAALSDYQNAFFRSYSHAVSEKRKQWSNPLAGIDIYSSITEQKFSEKSETEGKIVTAESIPHCTDPNKPEIRSQYFLKILGSEQGDLKLPRVLRNIMQPADTSLGVGTLRPCYTNFRWHDVETRYQFVDLNSLHLQMESLSNYFENLKELKQQPVAGNSGTPLSDVPEGRSVDFVRLEKVSKTILGKLVSAEKENKEDDEVLFTDEEMDSIEWLYSEIGLNGHSDVDLKFFYRFGFPAVELEVRLYPNDPNLSGGLSSILVGREVIASTERQQFAIGAMGNRNFGRDIGSDLHPIAMKARGRNVYYYDENFVALLHDGEGKRDPDALPKEQAEKGRTNLLGYFVEKRWDALKLPPNRLNLLSEKERAESLKNIEEFGNRWLLQKRKTFNSELADDLQNLSTDADKELAVRFEALKALLALGLPKSFESNDQLRSMVLGALSIPSPQQLVQTSVHCGLWIDPAAEDAGHTLSAAALRKQIEDQQKVLSPSCSLIKSEIETLPDSEAVFFHKKIYPSRFERLDKWLSAATSAGQALEKNPLLETSSAELQFLRSMSDVEQPDFETVLAVLRHVNEDVAEILARRKPYKSR